MATATIDLRNTLKYAYGRWQSHHSLVKARQIVYFCEQAPNPESRVTLNSDTDIFGLNKVDLRWQLTDLEKQTLEDVDAAVCKELGSTGIQMHRMVSLERGTSRWPTDLSWGWHQIGTTRMHADPRKGVVNSQGQVHGIQNLFIAGSSIFPTSGCNFPTLTIAALALRLADHLQAKLTETSHS